MLPTPETRLVTTHWGTYRAIYDRGELVELAALEGDPSPSPFGRSIIDTVHGPARILRPMVRSSFLEKGHRAGGRGRGCEPFVPVAWDKALSLVAEQLQRVRSTHGNSAIYGGSYGWASAGRFHHAPSQLKRFLNLIGGFVRSVDSYSYGAAEVILPHVIGDHRGLLSGETPWPTIAEHTELIVAFGGLSGKNAQVNPSGLARHSFGENLERLRRSGVKVVSVSPIRDDTPPAENVSWFPIRPTTDVALMLALAYVLVSEGREDRDFLERYTVGFAAFKAYLLGQSDATAKTPEWASSICGVPAHVIRRLARRMSDSRTLVTASWSLQRAEHGEQPYWMAIALAAMLGQIGLPGGGFGFGYGAVNGIGNPVPAIKWPSLSQGRNAVDTFIPVARISDMLLNPGSDFDYDGRRLTYPDIRLVYWAGGNPFHHHQDTNRFLQAWRQPEVVITHEPFWNATARHSDIVLPATVQIERNDIACSARDQIVAACHKLKEPAGEARDDHWILANIAGKFGVESDFNEDRDEEGWLRHLYSVAQEACAAQKVTLPEFETFWREGVIVLPDATGLPSLLESFRADPVANALNTPSGRIEILSERIAGFGYADCPGHPTWMEPAEWLGAPTAQRFGLQLMSNQPRTKLHSQLDHGINAREAKIKGREPIRMHPRDAAARKIADGAVVRVFNDRGACLAGACLSPDVIPGVVQLSTGAWYDPVVPGSVGSLDKHGNPNLVAPDRGTSRLAQACSANSCLVEVEPFTESLPDIGCRQPPETR